MDWLVVNIIRDSKRLAFLAPITNSDRIDTRFMSKLCLNPINDHECVHAPMS